MNREPIHILRQLKNGLGLLLFLAVVGELIFFPSLANLYGCFMAVIAYAVFMLFLKEKYIRIYPFAFIMYLSMFMYRFLPLIATMVEGKPISYGFERPFETFIYEIILFLVSSLAFYLACRTTKRTENNLFQKVLYRAKFFEITPAIIWGMGVVGFIIRLYNFSAGDVEYGDVGGKFFSGLDHLMYAPLLLIFPSLLNLNYSKNKIVWGYASLIFMINIASNSRQSIIAPIAVIALLFFLFIVVNNIRITKIISPLKLVVLSFFFILVINLLSDLSLAMLYTRAVRSEVNKLELFEKTIDLVKNRELINRLREAKDNKNKGLISYQEGWTEDYLDNFMLARYANMRISDETLYYAEKKGYANRQMQKNFMSKLKAILPTPVLSFFNEHLDKNDLEYSRGDILYGSGFGGYRVTSHLGDGLATFSYWYFPIQLLVFFLMFKLFNSYIYFRKLVPLYSPYGLMSIFMVLGKFRNAQGIAGDITFILRGYLQGIVTYLVIFYIVRAALMLVKPTLVHDSQAKISID